MEWQGLRGPQPGCWVPALVIGGSGRDKISVSLLIVFSALFIAYLGHQAQLAAILVASLFLRICCLELKVWTCKLSVELLQCQHRALGTKNVQPQPQEQA